MKSDALKDFPAILKHSALEFLENLGRNVSSLLHAQRCLQQGQIFTKLHERFVKTNASESQESHAADS